MFSEESSKPSPTNHSLGINPLSKTMEEIRDAEQAELFRHMMKHMTMTAERRPNGFKHFAYKTQAQNGEGKKIYQYYSAMRDERTRDERYAEYLRLREEFEGAEKHD
jgi:hypothetical protein